MFGRRQARHEGAAGGLHRPDEHAENQGRRPEPSLALNRQHRRAGDQQADQGDHDGRARADPIVQPGEGDGPQPGGDIEGDGEQDDFIEIHGEGAGGVNAAEGEKGRQTVGIGHAGQQKTQQLRLPADRAQGPPEVAEAGAGGRRQGLAWAAGLAGEQEQGQGENGEPQRRRDHRRADMLGRAFVEAERRRRRVDEDHQNQGQRAEAAEKADAPAPAGHPAKAVGGDQVGSMAL